MGKSNEWEKEFETVKPELDKRIEEQKAIVLEQKRNQTQYKDVTSQEYKECVSTIKNAEQQQHKAEKIKENSSKIENIINYKKALEGQLEVYRKELLERDAIERFSKAEKELQDKENELVARTEKIDEELKNSSLSQEEREKLEKEKKENLVARDDNNDKFMQIQKGYATMLNNDNKLKDLSMEDLKGKIDFTMSSISKCNMIGKTLLNGKDWKEVEFKLENWTERKFTSNKDALDKFKKTKKEEPTLVKPSNEKTSKEENEETTFEKGEESPVVEKDSPEEIKDIAELTEFETKHPKLAKFFNKIKSTWNKITKKDKGEEEKVSEEDKGEEEKVSEEEKSEIVGEVKKETGSIDFDKIAEEGNKAWDVIAKHGAEDFLHSLKVERKEELTNNEELMEKRRQNKEKAAEEYAEKYGGQYTKQDGQEEKESR